MRPSHCMAPSDPDPCQSAPSARCDRHEARAGIVVSLPACTQRSIRRGAALASRLDPLAFSGDKRGRSKALFFAVPNGTSISDPEPVGFSCDPENWAYGQSTSKSPPRRPQKSSSPLASVSPLVLQLYHCSIGFPQSCGARFTQSEDPDALGDDSFAVTQQQWRACVRRMLLCELSCILPPSSLDPRLVSFRSVRVAEEGAHTCLTARDSDA